MEDSKWTCEKCGKVYDLDEGEGWITLVEDEESHRKGKLSPIVAFECVCYKCADELLALAEKCGKDCANCDVSLLWGLSIMDCLKFQVRFDLLCLPQQRKPRKGSEEATREILEIFRNF